MSKQTAVEWLVDQIKSDQNQKALSPSEWMEVIEQANKMFEEQIEEAYGHGHNDGCAYTTNCKIEFKNSEYYYNETYKGGEQ